MDANVFRRRLAEAMEEKGMGQADLVRACMEAAPGILISRSDISRYLSGQSVPRPNKIGAMAQALGVQYGWLSGESKGGYTPAVRSAVECICEASRCPDIYLHAESDGNAYIVYVSQPPSGDVNAAMSFFSAAGGALQDAGTAELAARVMRAIRAGGVEKEILERLFPAADGAERKKASYSTDGLPTCPPDDAADVAQRQVRRVIRMRKRVQEHKKSGE